MADSRISRRVHIYKYVETQVIQTYRGYAFSGFTYTISMRFGVYEQLDELLNSAISTYSYKLQFFFFFCSAIMRNLL